MYATLIPLVLSACAQAPFPPPHDADPNRQPAANETTQPLLSGRIAVKVDTPHGDENGRTTSGSFELIGDAQRGQLRLLSPLGQVVADAMWTPLGQVSLRTAQEVRSFDSLAALSRQLLGEDIPLAALLAWMTGRPWSQAPHASRDNGGQFEQLGWKVDVAALQDQGLLIAQRLSPPAVTVRVRLDLPPLPTVSHP